MEKVLDSYNKQLHFMQEKLKELHEEGKTAKARELQGQIDIMEYCISRLERRMYELGIVNTR